MARALGGRIIGGARVQLLTTGALLFGSFAAQVGIARHFGFRGLGEYTATTLVIFFFATIALSGLPLASARLVSHHLEAGDVGAARTTAATGFVMAFGLTVLAGATSLLLWPVLSKALHIGASVPTSAVAVAIVAAGILGYVPLVFQGRLEVAMIGLVGIVQPLTVIVGLAVEILVFPGVLRPADLSLFGYLMGGLAALCAYVITGYGLPRSSMYLRDLVTHAFGSLPVVYVGTLAPWLDRLLVSLLLGADPLGSYQAAVALADGVLRLPRSASPFLVSAYARVSVDHGARLSRVSRVHVHLFTSFVVAAAAALFAGADGFLRTLYGPGGDPVIGPLRVLAVSLLPAVIALSLAAAATGAGAVRVGLQVSGVVIPLQVVLILVLGPMFGAVGAAEAQLIAISATFVGYALMSRRGAIVAPEGGLGATVFVGCVSLAGAAVLSTFPLAWPLQGLCAAIIAIALSSKILIGGDERLVLSLFTTRDHADLDAAD